MTFRVKGCPGTSSKSITALIGMQYHQRSGMAGIWRSKPGLRLTRARNVHWNDQYVKSVKTTIMHSLIVSWIKGDIYIIVQLHRQPLWSCWIIHKDQESKWSWPFFMVYVKQMGVNNPRWTSIRDNNVNLLLHTDSFSFNRNLDGISSSKYKNWRPVRIWSDRDFNKTKVKRREFYAIRLRLIVFW